MSTEHATVPLREDLEIPSRLGRLDDAERILSPGHGKIGGVIAGHLQEDAGIRAAFICLPGRVKEARAEPQTRGDMLGVTNVMTYRLQRALVRRIHLDVGKQ